MRQPIYQVDAFTAIPFAGNPAGVCVLAEERPDRWLQSVAREMNLSETAFLHRRTDGGDRAHAFDLRWFTPDVEVDLCGHATLASAHILWEQGILEQGSEARFHTRSGLLSARRAEDWIVMDFPSLAPEPASPPPGLLEALGVARAAAVAKSRFDYLVELDSAEAVRRIVPDHAGLRRVEARGIIVTARSDRSGYDIESRFFAPAVGVNEDPVTGSAHCALAPWWASRLRRNELVAWQASARGGTVRLRLEEDRVVLQGQAVTVLEGELIA
ncbi:MAG: PhzF family phenazine biosynthesis protein [Longimicrobiales bacterium]